MGQKYLKKTPANGTAARRTHHRAGQRQGARLASGYNIATAEISQDPLTGQWTDTDNG
jgi:hypothetical protein